MTVLTASASLAAQRRVAGSLRTAGAKNGDRVVFSVAGTADYVSAILGASRSGIVPVPLDPQLTPFERGAIINDVEPRLIIDDTPKLAALLDGPEDDLSPWPQCRPMHFTSGTTGTPKGVWSGFLSDDEARQVIAEEIDLWGFNRDDLNLVVSPIYHSAPLRFATATLLVGGSILVLPHFDPATFAEAVTTHAPTTMFCVPAHLQRLFAWQDATGDGRDLASFRLVAHAGAPCPDQVRRRAHDVFGMDNVWEFYGSTEGQWTACPGRSWYERPGTVGRSRPGRVVSVDADGLLWCAVPPWGRFEYWRDEEKTTAAWHNTPDGPAFTVGDLGRVEDSWVYLDARRTDLIITGGVNVYPAEIEATFAELPGVVEVAVLGRDDERWGQRVCAAYVGEVDEMVLRSHAAERLSPPKRPKEYIKVDSLPRTATGKVRRHEL